MLSWGQQGAVNLREYFLLLLQMDGQLFKEDLGFCGLGEMRGICRLGPWHAREKPGDAV